jgi:hypothetical protein
MILENLSYLTLKKKIFEIQYKLYNHVSNPSCFRQSMKKIVNLYMENEVNFLSKRDFDL